MNGFTKVVTMTCMLLTSAFNPNTEEIKDITSVETKIESNVQQTETETEFVPYQTVYPVMSCAVVENDLVLDLTEEEIELIALVTMAEAEGESEYGKRLVIDTIINRVMSEDFPDTVKEVIYQPHHFEAVWNGRIDVCYVDENICELVRGELIELSDPYVMYFCSGDYSRYGTPMYQVGNHYFSSF